MKRIRVSLVLTGLFLMASAFLTQFFDKEMATVLTLGLSGMMFAILGLTNYGKKQRACEIRFIKKHPFKLLGLSLGLLIVCGEIGFALGKLLYQLVHRAVFGKVHSMPCISEA